MYICSKAIADIFEKLNLNKIEYVIIKNINNELPNCLVSGKDIDILVKEGSYPRYRILMKDEGFRELPHPYGISVGWKMLYGMESLSFFINEDGVILDATTKLCCKSLGMNAWVPLDKSINNTIWENKFWDVSNNWWVMDEKTLFCYMIIRSIFDKREFKEPYILYLQENLSFVEDLGIYKKMETVFFKFTPYLFKLLREKKFDDIVKEYIIFADY